MKRAVASLAVLVVVAFPGAGWAGGMPMGFSREESLKFAEQRCSKEGHCDSVDIFKCVRYREAVECVIDAHYDDEAQYPFCDYIVVNKFIDGIFKQRAKPPTCI